MMNQNKCLGCGAIKQTTLKNEVGYVLDLDKEYCLDCFQLMNYGKSLGHNHPNGYLDIKEGSLVFIMQSVFQLDLLFTLPIVRIQPNAKYVYIINQIDLLPNGTNLDHLYNNVHKLAKKNNVKYHDIVFMSAINNNDINNLREFILNQEINDIYLFGFQNSGKTTLMKGLTNDTKALNINKAGLTQNIIEQKLMNKTIYDMPGTYVKGYMSDFFEYKEYTKLLPKKTIKPKIYQLKNTQKLVINDFIEISFKGIDKTNIVLYLNDQNNIMKYNINNTNNYLNEKFEYVEKTFKTFKNKTQITLSDLLFLHTTDEINIRVKYPKGMHVSLIESLIK